MSRRAVALAMTGASGAVYGLQLLAQLLRNGEQVYLLLSKPGQLVINMETDLTLPARARDIEAVLSQHYNAKAGQLKVLGREEWTAPVASGSGVPRAMVICPCTSGTLAAIASGLSRNLIERAADVVLKERRQLILVHRETPLSLIQLDNMVKLTRAGALIMPANPGFYHRPQQIDDLVNFMVSRILDQLSIDNVLSPRWGLEADE